MNEYFTTKDTCRQGLIKYLDKACSKIPRSEDYNILDIGCGSGVPTIWLAENFTGNVTAVDPDSGALKHLEQKLFQRHLQNKVNTVCKSFHDFKVEPEHYDIILAEGFLNVVGFENGFKSITERLKYKGFFIIHDEYKDHIKKLDFIKENYCTLTDTLYLDENVWWTDYYRQLEAEINKISDTDNKRLFKTDIEEIKLYRVNPLLFRSIYYIVKKGY